jgi:predicted membrane channel-forming protein YqfA (hemolysin III family)
MRARRMAQSPSPSGRKLAGIALILLLIVAWAAFVASLAQVVGRWPVLVQAPFYLVMGLAWIIPLKPLIRWMQTGSIHVSRTPRD